MSTFLFRKAVDQSLLKSGTTIPQDVHALTLANLEIPITKGQHSDIKIIINSAIYDAKLNWIDFSEPNAKRDILQIRYSEGSAIAQKLKELFSHTANILAKSNASNSAGNTPAVIPDFDKEFIEIYANGHGQFEFKCAPTVVSSLKNDFYKYLGKEDDLNGYQRSYKLVFLKAFFENLTSDGEVPVDTVSFAFQQYYIARKKAGHIPDANVDPIIENVESSSLKSIFSLILKNPFDAISKHNYMLKVKKGENEYFKLNEKLFSELSNDDIKNILQTIEKKLALYYSRIDAGVTAGGKMEEIINKILNDYIPAKSETFAGHPMGTFFRNDIPNAIYSTGIVDAREYLVTGSVGQGNWATVPWICIFDRNITTSATKGVYIVYLLSKDGQTLYLTLNQGCTDIRKEHSKRDAIKIMRENAATITANIDPRGFQTDENINLGSGLTELAELYQRGTIFYKEYRKGSVPSERELQDDLIKMMDIYKEYANEPIQLGTEWWPSEKEYTPGISKVKWLELLNNPKIFIPSSLSIMAAFTAVGGQASCAQLAETFGKTASFYLMSCVHLAERIISETKCPTIQAPNSKLWPVLFVGRDARKDERGSFIWKLRNELAEALQEFGIEKYLLTGGEKELSVKDTIENIKTYIASKGFHYEDGLIENFFLSLKSKPFVILAGTSGTGKTRLVKLFAEAVGATTANGRYQMISVRPDWSDSSDLLGHVDLNGKFIPGAIIDFVKRAELDSDKPYFLCLDEMNLARVEYYLSDILSVIETRDFVNDRIVTAPLVSEKFYGSDSMARGKYGVISLPENLYIIGTVNMDETTFPFSRKVLDRANTIEFSYVDLIPSDSDTLEVPDSMNLPNSFLKTKYLLLAQCSEYKEEVNSYCVTLQNINHVLQKANAHVGYRVRDEIVFYLLNNKNASLLNENDAWDNEIMQKILPRIQGSSASIKNMLCHLFKICAGDYESHQTETDNISAKMFKAATKPECKYKKSAQKIAFMVRRYEEDGFTSYWL